MVPVPVVQGGMGVGISMSRLASAVANEGGVGVISSAGLGLVHKNRSLGFIEANSEGLRKEIRSAREKSDGVLGVNIMVAMSNFAELVKTAMAEKIDVIFSGAGLPFDLPRFLTDNSDTKLVPIVSSGRAARLICMKWEKAYGYLPDAIVVEGPKAGGHLGFKASDIERGENTLEQLIEDVVKEVSQYGRESGKIIPVIAAGGIYTGRDIKRIIERGASGVQMGTRFVTTEECDASERFKQTYLEASESDIRIIQSPVGMPGRAIFNAFLEKVKEGLKRPVKCPFKCIRTCDVQSSPYCIITALYNAYRGRMKNGYAFAGSNAFLADRITTVREVFSDLLKEFNTGPE